MTPDLPPETVRPSRETSSFLGSEYQAIVTPSPAASSAEQYEAWKAAQKKLTRAEHIEALRAGLDWPRHGNEGTLGWIVDHCAEHGMEVAPDPLPEPPEPERAMVVRGYPEFGGTAVLAEPSYWRDHPDYAQQYEAWKAALS